MNFRPAILPYIAFLFAFVAIQTARPVIEKRHSCLAPILAEIADRKKRIKQVEKLFTKDIVNDTLLRSITRRMKPPLPDTLATYAKPQRSKKSEPYMPNVYSKQARDINIQIAQGRKIKDVDAFVEENCESAIQHLTTHMQFAISDTINDTEMAAFHTSILIALRKKQPELFSSDKEFNGILGKIVQFSAVLSGRDTTPEGPFQYSYSRIIAGTMRLNSTDLFTNIAYEIICAADSMNTYEDKTRMAYDFIQGLWEEKEGNKQKDLPALPQLTPLPENIKESFRRAHFEPEARYVKEVIEYFYAGDKTPTYEKQDISRFINSPANPDSDITFGQAAKQYLKSCTKTKLGNSINTAELMAYNISILILLRDKAPEVFERTDGKDFFAVILDKIITSTRLLSNLGMSISNFTYDNKMMSSELQYSFFLVAHEIGHKIFDYNVNILYEDQKQNMWLTSVKEIFSNIAAVTVLSEVGYTLQKADDLPFIAWDRACSKYPWIITKADDDEYGISFNPMFYTFSYLTDAYMKFPVPHVYSDTQTAVIITDSFLQKNYDVLLPAICESVRKTPPHINSVGLYVPDANDDKEPLLIIWRSRFGQVLRTAA